MSDQGDPRQLRMLYGSCAVCDAPRTTRTTTGPNGVLREMVCSADPEHDHDRDSEPDPQRHRPERA